MSIEIIQESSTQHKSLENQINRFMFSDYKQTHILLDQLQTLLQLYPDKQFQIKYLSYHAFLLNLEHKYPESAKMYEELFSHIEKNGNYYSTAEAAIDYAGVCINLSDFETAQIYLVRANKILKQYSDTKLQARFLCRYAFVYLHYFNYELGAEYLLKAEKLLNQKNLSPTQKNYYFLTLIHSGLGHIHERNDDKKRAFSAYQKVIKICEKQGLKTRLAWHYLHLGSAYMAIEDFEGAELFFNKTIDSSFDSNHLAKAAALANLGYCMITKTHYDEALTFLDEAEQIYKVSSPNDYFNLFYVNLWRASIYATNKKHKRALHYFTIAYEYANLGENYKQLSVVYRDLSEYHASRKQFKIAYEYHLLYSEANSLHQEEVNKKSIWELEVKYEAEKKEQQATLLQLKADQLQLKALRSQMDPHFMYNAMNSIQHYITSNEPSLAAKFLAKFAKLMRRSLDYSDNEKITLEQEISFLREYLFINQQLRFKNKLNYEININQEIEEESIRIPSMILQPFVENAIEHGIRFKASANIILSFEYYNDSTLLAIVDDNGIGRAKATELKQNSPKGKSHQSKGTTITEQRLALLRHFYPKSLNREIVKYYDKYNDDGTSAGTKVEILIPILSEDIE
ncbi:MAG: histidine kinase [Saprospiraceae bacterium]|nr:histidine kinase [Saprospiraceae bacterium]